jgi:hypothetical protein
MAPEWPPTATRATDPRGLPTSPGSAVPGPLSGPFHRAVLPVAQERPQRYQGRVWALSGAAGVSQLRPRADETLLGVWGGTTERERREMRWAGDVILASFLRPPVVRCR